MNESKEDTEFQIPLTDLFRIVKKGKKTILIGAVSCAALLGGYALTKPITYKGEATFKEKTNSQGGIASPTVTALLLSGMSSGNKSEAKSIMKSRKLLEQVVKSNNLQASLNEKVSSWPLFKTAYENIIVQYAYFRGTSNHPLPDLTRPLVAKNIEFPGELPISLTLDFTNEEEFQVFDASKNSLGSGALGIPFTTREFSFTIAKNSEDSHAGKTFVLTLIPMYDITAALSKQIKIEADKDDPSLLNITYANRDRYLARDIVNQLMYSYQSYLKTEQQRISTEQITYLNRREEEMGNNLESMISHYAKQLTTDVSTLGFADSEKAMEFLAGQLQLFRGKDLKVDLEISRLSRAQQENTDILIDAQFQGENTPYFINKMVDEITSLRLQEDALILAIRNLSENRVDKWEVSFQDLMVKIEDFRNCRKDACLVLADLENNRIPQKKIPLLNHPKYRLGAWYDQLDLMDKEAARTPFEKRVEILEKREKFKEQFTAYLKNLVHYLEVSEKAAEERVSHQQGQATDFQGITLNAANDLYIAYSKEISELEAQTLQLNFLMEELKDPDFEISSLSSVIVDPVTRKLVEEASTAVLALNDDHNRSDKEKERLKKELDTKRRFLAIHLEQTVNLLRLRQELIKEKTTALQNASLDLVHQQLSILEKHLYDSIAVHLDNLREEKKLIAVHQNEVKKEMSALPQKWASEKLIEHQLEMNIKMVEELTKLVETKIISANLERIQSAPVDPAVAPIRPVKPWIFLFSAFGAVLGTIFASGYVLTRGIIKGLPASKEGLELCGLHVAGLLRKDPESNVEALRRLEASARRTDVWNQGIALVFVNDKEGSLARQFATMIEKKGDSTLTFEIPEGESTSWEKLFNLKKEHRWLVAFSESKPNSVDAEHLAQAFDYSAMIIHGETLNQLSHLIEAIKLRGKSAETSFLIKEDQ